MSKKKSGMLRYVRDTVWVKQYPRAVVSTRLGTHIAGSLPWMNASILGAAVQTRPDGSRHVAVRGDDPSSDFKPGLLALQSTGITDESEITVLPPDDFDEFSCIYAGGINNTDGYRKLIPAIEKYVPAFRFMPKHLHRLLYVKEGEHLVYRHLPRFFLKFDLSPYEVLIWLERAPGQVSPKKFKEFNLDPERVLHLGGAWYACLTLDEAVTVKFLAPATEIHRLREDV